MQRVKNRGERSKYTQYHDESYESLFDLKNQPTEPVNLIDNPEHAGIVGKRQARMEECKATHPERLVSTEWKYRR